jgi:NADH-quinone oxidoreductase subunit E
MLSERSKQAILELQKQYPEKKSALIPALHLAQSEVGYLPKELQAEIAALFEISENEVNGVVTFYDMFFEKPVGKHLIHVCKNVSCMLRGSDPLIQKLYEKAGQNPEVFTIIPSECLGACDKAPMLIGDDKVYGPIALEDVDALLSKIKAGEGNDG